MIRCRLQEGALDMPRTAGYPITKDSRRRSGVTKLPLTFDRSVGTQLVPPRYWHW